MARFSFTDPNFRKQSPVRPCALCGKTCSETAKRIYLGDGSFEAITSDELDFDGVFAYVGSACEKKIPAEFYIDQDKE